MGVTLDIEDDKLLRRIYDKGHNLGFNEGRNEGRSEGRSEGEANLLRRQLGQKFGLISASNEERLKTASTEQLEIWGTRLLTAESIEETLK